MEMIPKKYETIADIPADEFLPLQKNTEEEREQITTPSLNFIQDSWRRLKKNKAAVVSMIVLAIIILISIVTIFVSPHDPTAQNVEYINLPPRIPGIDINGLNGKAMVGGELVDKYAQANVPANTNFFLGTDGLGRDVLSRFIHGHTYFFIDCIYCSNFRCDYWSGLWFNLRTIRWPRGQCNATFLRNPFRYS